MDIACWKEEAVRYVRSATLRTYSNGSFAPAALIVLVLALAAPAVMAAGVPTGLTATAKSSSQIDLSWTTPADSAGLGSYKIFRGGTPLATPTLGTAMSYSDSGLSPSTPYSYTVAACDTAGNNCSAQSAAVLAATYSSAGIGGDAKDTSASFTLNGILQIPAVDAGATGVIYVYANVMVAGVPYTFLNASGNWVLITADTDTYPAYSKGTLPSSKTIPILAGMNVTSLPGTQINVGYGRNLIDMLDNKKYTVICTIDLTATPPCKPISDAQAPSVPAGLGATAKNSTQIDLSWTASTDNVGVAGYKVYRNGNATPVNSTLITANSYSDTGLTASTFYSYNVAACDAAGNCSPQSAIASAVALSATPDTQAPTVPTGLSGTPKSSTQIDLSWTASTDNIGVTAYKVYRTGTLIQTLGNVTGFSDTGLTANSFYTYIVTACDAAGNCSAQSGAAIVATSPAAADSQAPTAPSGLTLIPASASQITLSWTASTDNVGVTAYKIYRGATSIALVQFTTASGTVTSYSDTGLTPSTTYYYAVAACDAAGNCSGQSTPQSATTLSTGTGTGTGTSTTCNVAAGETTQAGDLVYTDFIATYLWPIPPATGAGPLGVSIRFTPNLPKFPISAQLVIVDERLPMVYKELTISDCPHSFVPVGKSSTCTYPGAGSYSTLNMYWGNTPLSATNKQYYCDLSANPSKDYYINFREYKAPGDTSNYGSVSAQFTLNY